jgi:hypothetical protein
VVSAAQDEHTAPFLDLTARRQVPALIRRLLPQPCTHFEGWIRYSHLDVADMTSAQRTAERWRIQVALGQLDDADGVPPWLLARLDRLTAGSPRAVSRTVARAISQPASLAQPIPMGDLTD